MSKEKIQKALQGYMDSLGYDDGITAMKRGGQMRLSKKFGIGGYEEVQQIPVDESYIYDANGQIAGLGSDHYIRQYWNQHPDEYLKLYGADSVGQQQGFDWSQVDQKSLMKGMSQFGSTMSSFGKQDPSLGKNINMSTPWSAIAGTAGSLTVDALRGIDSAIRQWDKHDYSPMKAVGLARGGRKFDGGGFTSGIMDKVNSGAKILSNALYQTQLTTDYDTFADAVNRYKQDQLKSLDDISDNSALLAADANRQILTGNLTGRNFRDKTVLSDFVDGLASSFEGFNATGNWIGAVLGGVSSNLGSIYGRVRAFNAAEKGNGLVADVNHAIQNKFYNTGKRVDSLNDAKKEQMAFNNPFNYNAYGGELRTHGLDFNNGFTFINEGGTHEQNPLEGVPSGVDENGVPNLVEEGEVIWNNEYVFSNRIKIPKHLADKYRLDTSMTFADAIKEVTKESLTRPNDPISNETNKALVNEFMDEQEAIREKEQAKAKAKLREAYDEDFANQLEMAQAMPQAVQGPVAPVQLQGMPQGTMEEAPMMGAFGGRKFDGGGWKDYYTIETDEYGNTYYLAPDGVRQYSEAGAKKHYELNGGSWVAPSVKTERVSKVEKAEPKDNVEPVYSRDGRQFRGYKVRGTRGPIYGSYDIAKSVADGKGVPAAQTKQRKQTQAPQSAQQPAQTGQPASATAQQPQRARIEVVGNHIPDYRTQMLADLQTVLEGPVTFSSQLAEPLSEAIDRAMEENPDVAEQLAETVNKPVTQKPADKTSPTGRASSGTGSAPRGKKDTRGTDSEGNPLYKTLVETLDKASDEDKKAFVDEINKSLPEGKKVKDYDTWKKKATDGIWGSVHEATVNFVNARAEEAKTRTATTAVDPNSSKPLSTTVITPEEGLAGGTSYRPSKSVPSTPEGKTSGYGATDWARLAPIIGTGAMAFNDIIQGPKYGNADAIIAAARQAGVPVNIPVNTIGDYMTYKPFDERYLVNMANQNRAAAARGIVNTANGNRAMDILGNMALAHSSQQELGEIMRQAYLANQTERARVAEFNRGTNIQNMSALNQRNLTQAQLNSQRQATALSGLARGYGMREEVWRDWRNDRDENLTAFLDNLGTWGREKETDSMAASLARELGYNWEYDPKTMQYVFKQTSAAKGGYKRKKRRF